MRRFILAMALCSIAALVAALPAPMPAPIAYYPFSAVGGGTAEAISGQAVSLPSPSLLRTDAVSGTCLELRRQDDSFVSLGRKYGFQGDFRLSFWLRTAPGYSEGGAIVMGRHQAGSYNGYFVQLNAAWGYWAPDKLCFYYSNASVVSKTSFNDGAWHQVGIAYRKASGAELYMDGRLEAKGPPNPIVVPNVDFVLGSVTWDRPRGTFAGSIDELALYDEALGPQDFVLLAADPGLLARQFAAKGGGNTDFFGGGSTVSTIYTISALRIILKDGRVATIPIGDIERIEFVK